MNKEQLLTNWDKLHKQIDSIKGTIIKIEQPEEISILAEKIQIMNRTLQSTAIHTLTTLFDIENRNPLICSNCHCKLNLIDGSLSCENPDCISNG